MIGGGGERKTLRFVARYAQACNLFPGPDLARKLDVLRAHCDAEGRDYDEITKTCYFIFDPGEKGEKTAEMVDQLGNLAADGLPGGHRRGRQRLGRHPAGDHRQRGDPPGRQPCSYARPAASCSAPLTALISVRTAESCASGAAGSAASTLAT